MGYVSVTGNVYCVYVSVVGVGGGGVGGQGTGVGEAGGRKEEKHDVGLDACLAA